VEDEAALLGRALAGDTGATRELVSAVLPVVQVRVARALSRRRARSGRDVRQEVEDLAQEVFATLFEKDGRVLRAWDSSRGLPLASFCGLIAEREAASILRSGRRSPWTEDATASEDLERDGGIAPDAELYVASREELERVTTRLREELSPRGLEMFQRLIVDEEPVESVCSSTGMTPDAVYAWRSRVGKLARKLAAEGTGAHIVAGGATSARSDARIRPGAVSEAGRPPRRSEEETS
jgi:RNA polymerase sigma-70 factor (ECF subfamily)